VIEVTITASSPAAGQALGRVGWPDGSIPVSVLRRRSLIDPDPGLTLAAGDRVSLLAPIAARPESLRVRSEDTSRPGGTRPPDGRTRGDAPRASGAPPTESRQRTGQ
jgi:hypothetical protein